MTAVVGFSVTGRAMRELRDAAITVAGADTWDAILATLPDASRAAFDAADGALIDERHWVEALHLGHARIEGDHALARTLGRARAEAVLAGDGAVFTGDPLRFLRVGASLYYKDRANYGASLCEMAPRKAVVRFVASPGTTLKRGTSPNESPFVIAAFLEHAASTLAESPQPCRYLGHTPRADQQFGQQVFNQLFEFELESDEEEKR
ncbi:MAG: hypothetical protein NVSMB47_06520 [Polyangiales bacterium]